MKASLRACGVVLAWSVFFGASSFGQGKTLLQTYKGPLQVKIVYNSGKEMTDRIVSYDGRLKKIQLGTTTISLPNKVNLERGGHLQKWWSRDTQARTKFPKFPTESGLYAGRLISYYKQRFPAEVNAIVYSWPDAARKVFFDLANEQYDDKILQAARPYAYRALNFHEIPPNLFPIHDNCLIFAQALLAKEQFNEAFNLLYSLNLAKLDEYGYREFSETALGLAGKMIAANPASAKHVQTLLAKVNIRDDANDHQAYLELCDALRRAKQYGEAVSEYGRLQAVLARSPRSPLKNLVGIWPIYCRFKQSEDHMTNGAKYAAAAANPSLTPEQKAQYAAASRQLSGYANQFFNAAEQPLLKLADSPPKRQSNEYSLYKLLRAIHKDLNARRQEDLTRALQAAAQQAAAAGQEDDARARMAQAASATAEAAESRRQSVQEVTEGIVMARVGLDWLPESLLMAGGAYTKLAARQIAEHEKLSASGRPDEIEKSRKSINGYLEAARNVYDQVDRFFKGKPVAAEALKLKAALPAGV